MNETIRTYGWTRTELKLSKEAQAIYNETDPLQIIEVESADGSLSYNLIGCIEATGISAEEVEDLLISFGEPDEDELADFYTLDTEEPETWGNGAYNGMLIPKDEVLRLSEEWERPLSSLLRELDPVDEEE